MLTDRPDSPDDDLAISDLDAGWTNPPWRPSLVPAASCATLPFLPGFPRGTQPLSVIPPQLGEYRVHELLARGGMGGVYVGEHVTSGVRVALKILDPRWAAQDVIVSRLLGEREVTNRVQHHGLVRILGGAHLASGVAYLAMELLDGEDLGALVERGRIEPGAAAAIGAQIADAVAAMHDAQIVHCDLKPDNIMVEYQVGLAGWPCIKVLDFGVARIGARDAVGEIAGTPCYMAPEQWRGHAEQRSDVYGLGVLLYELLTGDVPFEGSLPQVMTQHCDELPTPISARRAIPEPLERLVMRMLAKEPGMRPRMVDVAHALTDIAYASPPGACSEPQRYATGSIG